MNAIVQVMQSAVEMMKHSLIINGYMALKSFIKGDKAAREVVKTATTHVTRDTMYYVARNGMELAAKSVVPPAFQPAAKVGAAMVVDGACAGMSKENVSIAMVKTGIAAANTMVAGPLGGLALTAVTNHGVDMMGDAITHAYKNYANAKDQKAFQTKLDHHYPSQFTHAQVQELDQSFILIKAAPAA